LRVGRFRFLSTLRGQIVVIYTLLFAIAFFFVSLSVTKLVGEFLISQRTGAQLEAVKEIASQFGLPLTNRDSTSLYSLCLSNANGFSGRVIVTDEDGIVLADSHSELNGRIVRHPEVVNVLSYKTNASLGFHRVATAQTGQGIFGRSRDWAVYYTAAIEYQSRGIGLLLVSVSIQDVVDLIQDAVIRFTLVAIGILTVLIIASVIVSRYISLPIVQMTESIQRMRAGEFNERAKVRGNSEIAQMARTFNDMSEQLENVERQRQEFVANASHELKTPLSAIKILTEALLYEHDVPESTYKEFLSDINNQIDRLDSLLNDLLILAQSERSHVVMRYTTEQLGEMVAECARTLLPIAMEKKIAFHLPENSVEIRCDRLKLSTALVNLISNGIKYTPPGGSVSVSIEDEDNWVVIEVSDTGIGIPEEDRMHVFERFYRVDRARSRGTGGTGLGLAIVSQIVRLHGGEIALSSRQGLGSTFTVRLPQWGVDEK
jgi:signal transduction histidine kinase